MGIRANNLWLKGLSLAAVFWFACFVLVVPALHTHNAVRRAGSVSSAKMVSHASADAPVIASASAPVPTLDDCFLCQWLGAEWTSLVPAVLVFVVLVACANLLLAVRLTALCARPAPRRGLRAPPAFSLA